MLLLLLSLLLLPGFWCLLLSIWFQQPNARVMRIIYIFCIVQFRLYVRKRAAGTYVNIKVQKYVRTRHKTMASHLIRFLNFVIQGSFSFYFNAWWLSLFWHWVLRIQLTFNTTLQTSGRSSLAYEFVKPELPCNLIKCA